MSITPGQCKAARELLGWQQSELAYDLGVTQTDISLFEAGKRGRALGERAAIQRTLEAAGVEFIAENGGGAGVRLRKAE
jgi:transcriptional regulator with XRE-family HTH domain